MDVGVLSNVVLAKNDSTTTVDYLVFIPTLIVAFLSVPFVTAALTALARFVSPSARLAARLKDDLAMFVQMPPSPQRDAFERQMNEVMAQLNNRRAVSVTGSSTRVRWRVATLTGTATAVGAGVIAIFTSLTTVWFPSLATTHSHSVSPHSAVPVDNFGIDGITASAVVVGAVLTAAFAASPAVRRWVKKLRKRWIKNHRKP
jgi:hypothetical protein